MRAKHEFVLKYAYNFCGVVAQQLTIEMSQVPHLVDTLLCEKWTMYIRLWVWYQTQAIVRWKAIWVCSGLGWQDSALALARNNGSFVLGLWLSSLDWLLSNGSFYTYRVRSCSWLFIFNLLL